jgi:VIT1/CCC1 family predicted Fe2+/Mn2+ transporter
MAALRSVTHSYNRHERWCGMPHGERHRSERIGWLRAAVLGANDGIVSTASLVVGVAAAASARQDVLIAGVAGLVAGALSMAAGEYVSARPPTSVATMCIVRLRIRTLLMIDLELDSVEDTETLLEKLRRLWTGSGGAVMRNPEAWIVEAVESRSV